MTTRVWFENDAIQMDGVGVIPARGLYTVLDGDRVHIFTLSGDRTAQLLYGEYARKDGSSFTSASQAKTYLDGEFAKAAAGQPTWDAVTGKPTTFPPSAHTHPISDVSGLQGALDGKQAAGSYAPLSHVSDQNNPHNTTKAQVGLGNVDNTSDAAKPISTATQTALNGKANTAHTHVIADVTGLQAALDGKLSSIPLGAPTARTVALGTAYQATTPGKAAFVTINLTSTASLSLTGGGTNTADIVIGPTNAVAAGTGTAIGKYGNSNTGTLTVGLALSTIDAKPLGFPLPAGWWFAVRQTAGTVSIVSAFDQVIG